MKKLLVALLATLALLFVSACGGGSDSDDSSGSDDNVGEAKDVELTKDNFAEEISKAQLDAGSAHMKIDMDAAGQAITMDGDFVVAEDPADVALSMSMDAAGQSMDMRMVDQVIYINMGELSQNKFAKIDTTDTSNPVGEQMNQMMEQSNPAAQVEAINEAMTDFEDTGETEDIDGVEATKYVITTDAKKVLESQGQDASQMAGIPDTIEYSMWVGEDHLPRRMEMDLAVSGQETSTTIEMTKWGEDVKIEAPSDDEISEESIPGLS